jgi:hypothetical protein
VSYIYIYIYIYSSAAGVARRTEQGAIYCYARTHGVWRRSIGRPAAETHNMASGESSAAGHVLGAARGACTPPTADRSR